MLKFVAISMFLFLRHLSFALDLPSSITKCRYGNETCLVDSLNSYIRLFAKGVPHTKFRPFDRLPLPDFALYNSTHDLPVWLTIMLKDQLLKGLENATVTQMKGFERDPTLQNMKIQIHVPRIEHEGVYNYQAKLLYLRLNGTGPIKSDMQNAQLTLVFKVYVEYRNEKRHLKVYNLVPQIELSRWILWGDTLYAENTDLTIVVNRAFNENWLELWNELEPNFIPILTQMGVSRLSRFFSSFAYDDMFLKD